jgi:NitT/TauT family transport system substrate-binding protein
MRHRASRCLVALAALSAVRCTPSKPAGGGAADAAAAAAAPAAAAPAATKLTVATIPIVDVAPIYLGKQKGFFAEAGIDLTLQPAQGGAAIVPGVVSGQFQFGFGNVVSLLLAQSKGLPLKVVASGNSTTGKQGGDFGGLAVPAGSPLKTAKDLEGKTASSNTLNNIGDLCIRASVRKAGGDPSKVKFVEVGFPDVPAAIAEKRVDAAFAVEPALSVVKKQGGDVIAWPFVDCSPDLMVAAYFTSREYADKNPDMVKRFAAAMNRSLTYASEHPDEARAVLTTYTKINQEMAATLTLPRWSPELSRASTDAIADMMVQDKLVAAKPDVAALFP